MARLASVLAATLLLPAAAAAQPDAPPRPTFERARLGLEIRPTASGLREHLAAPEEVGVLVVRVDRFSPAERGGVRVGDVITRAGGRAIAAPHHLIGAVARVPRGGRLQLRLVREGEAREVEVEPERRPGADIEALSEWMRSAVPALRRRLDELKRRREELARRTPEPWPI